MKTSDDLRQQGMLCQNANAAAVLLSVAAWLDGHATTSPPMEPHEFADRWINYDPDAMKAVIKRLRAEMLSRGVTLRRMAESCGVSPSQLSEWTSEPVTTMPDFVRTAGNTSHCQCHERDSSYVCEYCYANGLRGTMQG
jgi:hypothetical protein